MSASPSSNDKTPRDSQLGRPRHRTTALCETEHQNLLQQVIDGGVTNEPWQIAAERGLHAGPEELEGLAIRALGCEDPLRLFLGGSHALPSL